MRRLGPHYVYRQFNKDGDLLYVGATSDWVRREGDHLRISPWRFEIHHTDATKYPTREIALAHERLAIETEAPLYNQVGADAGPLLKHRISDAHRKAGEHSADASAHDDLYSTPQAQVLSGVTFRQIDYWARRGLLKPTVEASGSGTHRRWSRSDLTIIDAVGRVSASCSPKDLMRRVADAVGRAATEDDDVVVELGEGVSLTVSLNWFADSAQVAS